MNLKKRAAGAIAVAMSVVVMTSVAQAAPADYKTGVASQATTTDLATNGIAGIAVSMSQYESDAYEYIELADANVEQMNVARVTSGDAAEQDAEGGLTEMSADVADGILPYRQRMRHLIQRRMFQQKQQAVSRQRKKHSGRTALWQTSTTIYMSELPQMLMQRS